MTRAAIEGAHFGQPVCCVANGGSFLNHCSRGTAQHIRVFCATIFIRDSYLGHSADFSSGYSSVREKSLLKRLAKPHTN